MKIQYRTMYKLIMTLLAAAAALMIAGYVVLHPDISANQKERSRLIGASYMTMNNEFYEILNEQISHRVEAEGDRLILRNPALSVSRQVEQIGKMLDEGISVLILTPVDSDGLTDILKKARQQGVKIIVVDSNVSDEQLVDCTIVSDNYRAGCLLGDYLLQNKENSKVVILTHEAATSGRERVQGFLDTIGGHEGIEVVEKVPCEGQLEIAMPQMEKLIEQGKEFDSVFCLNDPSCIGAAAALDSKGLLESVELYGVDASPEVKAMIRDGMIKGSVAQSPTKVGEQAADALYDLLRGQKVDPLILVPVELVTQENVEEHNVDRWQ